MGGQTLAGLDMACQSEERAWARKGPGRGKEIGEERRQEHTSQADLPASMGARTLKRKERARRSLCLGG